MPCLAAQEAVAATGMAKKSFLLHFMSFKSYVDYLARNKYINPRSIFNEDSKNSTAIVKKQSVNDNETKHPPTWAPPLRAPRCGKGCGTWNMLRLQQVKVHFGYVKVHKGGMLKLK